MALPSQAGAGVQIERRDGKGRHANGDEDEVKREAHHWISFPAGRRPRAKALYKHAIMTVDRNFSPNWLLLRLKMLQATNAASHIAMAHIDSSLLNGPGYKNFIKIVHRAAPARPGMAPRCHRCPQDRFTPSLWFL
jgi:hypothetical protein